MNAKELVRNWSLPDVSGQVRPFSLRLPLDDYAKLRALKEVFPSRSLNDLASDILHQGLAEVIEALPVWKEQIPDPEWEPATREEHDEYEAGVLPHPLVNSSSGPGIVFKNAYERVLKGDSKEESEEGGAQ